MRPGPVGAQIDVIAGPPASVQKQAVVVLRTARVQAGNRPVHVPLADGFVNSSSRRKFSADPPQLACNARALPELSSVRGLRNGFSRKPDGRIQIHTRPQVRDFGAHIGGRNKEMRRNLALNPEIPVYARAFSDSDHGKKALIWQRWEDRILGIVVVGIWIAAGIVRIRVVEGKDRAAKL